MSVMPSYIATILIWSTTPLAIKFSSDSVSPIAALCLRMLIALTCALLVVALWKRADFFKKRNAINYFVASLALFPNMPLVYYASQTISSGLISVLFGLMPFVTALFAIFILGENSFTPRRILAQTIALVGLILISSEQLALGEDAFIGVLLMVASTCVYGFSNVWLKKISARNAIHPFDQTTGALAFAMPGLLLCWYFMDGKIASDISQTSAISIGYLAMIGSLVGFVTFFHIHRHMDIRMVSLIPVITPVIALWIGQVFVGEELTQTTMIGVCFIIFGLILYEGISRPQIIKLCQTKWTLLKRK